MKNVLTSLFTLIILPFATVSSVAVVSLLLALIAFFSPLLILDATLAAAEQLSNTLTSWLISDEDNTFESTKIPLVSALVARAFLVPLLVIPVTVGIVIATGLVSIVLVLLLAVLSAYNIAQKAINRVFKTLNLNKKELVVEQSYTQLTQD